MIKKTFLPVGTRVQILKVAVPDYTKKRQRSLRIDILDEISEAVIVGGTYFSEGLIEHDEEWGNCFTTKKKIFVYWVRTGFINKPMRVLPKDLRIKNDDYNFLIKSTMPSPFPFCKNNSWSKQDREDLRQTMADVPRDSKGRWIK